jgi:cell wall-associated NlpC family hydrolase
MNYGVCPISVAPLRSEPRDTSEMVSQVLYGEFFKTIESRKKWSRIRLAHDGYEGWMDNKQLHEITSEQYHQLDSNNNRAFAKDAIHLITHLDGSLSTITMGSIISTAHILENKFNKDDAVQQKDLVRSNLIETSLLLLNTPYLWGGRTPLGIDCSGFTQLVYRMGGVSLLRDASQQATQGEVLSFIEESAPGDLAFFDNKEGEITHVGIIMQDNHIIHAHGKVRIDRLDQTGIFNVDQNIHSHKLRMIKSIT